MVFGKHLAAGEEAKGALGLRELFYPGFQAPPLRNLPQKLFLGLKGLDHIESMARLLAAVRAFRPDIIHFQWAPLPVVDRWFVPAFRAVAPTLLTVHDSAPFNDNPRSRLQRLSSTSIMRRFDHLIVHTERARQRLLTYGVAPERVSRVPHGILGVEHMPATAPPPPAAAPDRPVTLLLFGKVKPYKGTDVLIRAIAAMPAAARPKVRLRVVGKPYMDMEPLFALARELGVDALAQWDLRFVDEDEMPAIFAEADVMVMPYREIDASGVLMSAMAAGRPIVASRIGNFAETLEDGRHGRLVAPDDPAALAQALTEMVEAPERRLAMGRAVRELLDSIPDWTAIGKMTEAVYRLARRS